MSSDDCEVHNIYRYKRKSYKKGHRDTQNNDTSSPTHNLAATESPRIDERDDGHTTTGFPGCSCMDSDVELANILHKKCPVISLAQQQLQRLLDETDKLLCDNTRCCRSIYEVLYICKNLFLKENISQLVLIILTILLTFIGGLLFGAATCGSHLGRFNSPIFTCIENFFIANSYSLKDSYLGIT